MLSVITDGADCNVGLKSLDWFLPFNAILKMYFIPRLSILILQARTSPVYIVPMIIIFMVYWLCSVLMETVPPLVLVPSLTTSFCFYIIHSRSICPVIIIITTLLIISVVIGVMIIINLVWVSLTISDILTDVYKRQTLH